MTHREDVYGGTLRAGAASGSGGRQKRAMLADRAAETAAAGLTARSGAAASEEGPDPEVAARRRRCSFTADYKRRILHEADAAKARPPRRQLVN